MVKYSCENCQSIFSQKGHLEAHKKRRHPCKKNDTLDALVEKKVQEILSKTNGIVPMTVQSSEMDNKTRDALVALCKEENIKGYSGKKKSEIIEMIKSHYETKKIDQHQPTFIEVCAGCGGLSSGFIEAGFKPLLINEIDKTSCKTLRKITQMSMLLKGVWSI